MFIPQNQIGSSPLKQALGMATNAHFFSRQSNLTTPETFKMGALSKVPFVDLLVKPCQGLASGLHPSLLLSTLFILSLAGHLPP